jgi:hypothetical protein
MQKANTLSVHQLFNIARCIAGISLRGYCKSLRIPASPSTVIACLDGRWKNKKIEKSIHNFIGLNLSQLAFFFMVKQGSLKKQNQPS